MRILPLPPPRAKAGYNSSRRGKGPFDSYHLASWVLSLLYLCRAIEDGLTRLCFGNDNHKCKHLPKTHLIPHSSCSQKPHSGAITLYNGIRRCGHSTLVLCPWRSSLGSEQAHKATRVGSQK